MIGKDFAENSFYVGLADFFGYLISGKLKIIIL